MPHPGRPAAKLPGCLVLHRRGRQGGHYRRLYGPDVVAAVELGHGRRRHVALGNHNHYALAGGLPENANGLRALHHVHRGNGAAVEYINSFFISRLPVEKIQAGCGGRKGCGRACVRLLAQMAFRDLGAHRFWLDVKGRNLAAQALYRSEGFVEEGRLRESVRTDDGYDALIVMAMLQTEHAALFEARAQTPPAVG